jgi:hypothetical protein
LVETTLLEYSDTRFDVALPIEYVIPADGKMLPVTVSPPLTTPPVFRIDIPYTFERAAAVGALDVLEEVHEL